MPFQVKSPSVCVAPVLVLLALALPVAAEPEASIDAELRPIRQSSLLTNADMPLVHRLVGNIQDIDGNAALLLAGDVRELLPDAIRAPRSPKRRQGPAIYLLSDAEEFDEDDTFPRVHDGFREQRTTFASCALWRTAENGKYNRQVDFAIERIKTSVFGDNTVKWVEHREDCSRTPHIRATLWIRFDAEGAPHIGQALDVPGDPGPPKEFSVESEARFVCGDAAAFQRGETVRMEWTEESMAKLRDTTEAFLAESTGEHVGAAIRANDLEDVLAIPLLRAMWDKFVNDDIFANRDCVLVFERGNTVFSVTVPRKE